MTTEVLRLDAIHFEQNYKRLFNNYSCSITAAAAWQILGENGSGKTTLLRIMAGLQDVDSGKVSRHARGVLYVGHTLGLKPFLTVRENVAWQLVALNCQLDEEKLLQALQLFSLTHDANTWVSHLSAGQQRRVALLKLALVPAALWFLDEPFNTLDKEGVKLLTQLISEHVRAEGTVVFTSHQNIDLKPLPMNFLELTDGD